MTRTIYEMSTNECLSRGIASPGQILSVMLRTLAKLICMPLLGTMIGWLLVCELFNLTLSPLWVLDQVVFALTH